MTCDGAAPLLLLLETPQGVHAAVAKGELVIVVGLPGHGFLQEAHGFDVLHQVFDVFRVVGKPGLPGVGDNAVQGHLDHFNGRLGYGYGFGNGFGCHSFLLQLKRSGKLPDPGHFRRHVEALLGICPVNAAGAAQEALRPALAADCQPGHAVGHNPAGDRLLTVNAAVRFHHSTFSSPAESFFVSIRPVADNAAARRKKAKLGK